MGLGANTVDDESDEDDGVGRGGERLGGGVRGEARCRLAWVGRSGGCSSGEERLWGKVGRASCGLGIEDGGGRYAKGEG